ncbi:MAG: hypothetical protein ACLUQK_09200 [Clostridium sp.]|uniref:hypothetical protein n=1 Tax=Clostridium innocuum TaxID=1522 RepID=UPI001AF2295D|nr:hypothetical protein [[Clostridium] innocuum]MCR0246387.1 hypothetical protein [[Clostridium] innocuum]MCR0392349.1 hypothetical protein [[Clostridium] innocuum]MCR0502030.1 hypothetical protein [[Clostridium] innocuum]QSI24790.1 hypothetical protein GKZ87_04330 [Erysipelotrichaceae bacterium 66202529]
MMNTKMQKILFFIWIAINWLAVLYLDKSRYGVLFFTFSFALVSCIQILYQRKLHKQKENGMYIYILGGLLQTLIDAVYLLFIR